MRTLVDLSETTFDRIQTLVRAGTYSSLQKFFEVAAENQLGLEEQDASEWKGQADVSELADGASARVDLARFRVASSARTPEGSLAHAPDVMGFVPETGQWIWGQVNNVLGIKFVARSLLLQQTKAGGPVEADVWFKQLKRDASMLQGALAALDRAAGRSRVAAWSKSFPTDDPASTKRFARQYAGEVRRDGRVVGAGPWLGLITWFPADDSRPSDLAVKLTEMGIRFAQMPNPVLDASVEGADETAKLSPDEQRFYRDEIALSAAPEHEAFACIGSVLTDEGEVAAARLRELVGERYPNWSPTQATTYTSGALARMDDVGLVIRHHPGTARASYSPHPSLLAYVNGEET